MPTVRGQLKSIWPDRTQYKPYAYNLEMQNVFVQVDIPDDGIVEFGADTKFSEGGDLEITEKTTVLNLNGFMCLLESIADSIDGMHSKAMDTKLKKLKSENKRMFSEGDD